MTAAAAAPLTNAPGRNGIRPVSTASRHPVRRASHGTPTANGTALPATTPSRPVTHAASGNDSRKPPVGPLSRLGARGHVHGLAQRPVARAEHAAGHQHAERLPRHRDVAGQVERHLRARRRQRRAASDPDRRVAFHGVIVALLMRWAVNLLALWVAAELFDGVTYDEFSTLALAAIVFALVNFAVRPIVTLLTLPLIILTLGIAYFFVNLLMLLLTAGW